MQVIKDHLAGRPERGGHAAKCSSYILLLLPDVSKTQNQLLNLLVG
jgi:hypothetical protein